MLPTVDFCGFESTRLIIGANPFGGYSHQNADRDEAMRSYHTVDRIIETWHRAEAAGINTMISNNETPHVVEAMGQYLGAGGNLNWIAQVNCLSSGMLDSVDIVTDMGCKALFFHGGQVDNLYTQEDEETLRSWIDHAKAKGIPVGVAAHHPNVHYWVDGLDIADFHMVCFFNCGSLHSGAGHKFGLADVGPAAECTRRIQKPCIGYKIMGAGRIDARMAFEYAFDGIKPTDLVNVGMHRGDNDNMVEENAGIVRDILLAPVPA
jgi:hypothetical protein